MSESAITIRQKVKDYFEQNLSQEFEVQTHSEYNEDMRKTVFTISVKTEEAPLDFDSFQEMCRITGTQIIQLSASDDKVNVCLTYL